MPTSRHFCSRHDWHRFLVTLLMTQTLSRWHVYTMFFWMLLRKKPWQRETDVEKKGNRKRCERVQELELEWKLQNYFNCNKCNPEVTHSADGLLGGGLTEHESDHKHIKAHTHTHTAISKQTLIAQTDPLCVSTGLDEATRLRDPRVA